MVNGFDHADLTRTLTFVLVNECSNVFGHSNKLSPLIAIQCNRETTKTIHRQSTLLTDLERQRSVLLSSNFDLQHFILFACLVQGFDKLSRGELGNLFFCEFHLVSPL